MTKSKENIYASKLISKISEMFNNEDDEFYIDINDFKKDNNLTDFIQALANVMPNHIYNTIVNDDKNMLDFNHMANHLVFQYSQKED